MMAASLGQKSSSMHYVFQLAHPETHEAYFIFSGDSLRKRLNDLSGETNHPVYYWLRSLRAQGLEPEATTLAEVASREEAGRAKRDWIQRRKPLLNGKERTLPPHIKRELEKWKRMYPPPSFLAYEQEERLRSQQEIQYLMTALGLTEREAEAYHSSISGVPHLDDILQTIRFTEQVLKHTPRFTDGELARLVLTFYGFYEERGGKEDVTSNQHEGSFFPGS
jgi:hypothetical protein